MPACILGPAGSSGICSPGQGVCELQVGLDACLSSAILARLPSGCHWHTPNTLATFVLMELRGVVSSRDGEALGHPSPDAEPLR